MELLEIRKVVMKSRYIIGGLILESIPQELEQIRFILNLENGMGWQPVSF